MASGKARFRQGAIGSWGGEQLTSLREMIANG